MNNCQYNKYNKIEKEKVNFNGRMCSNEIEDLMIICTIKDN